MQNKVKEIKIIAKVDQSGLILPHNVLVMVDDETVGTLQSVKFHADVDNPVCDLELTFPDLNSPNISSKYTEQPNLISTVNQYIEKFSGICGIKVNLKDIFKDI